MITKFKNAESIGPTFSTLETAEQLNTADESYHLSDDFRGILSRVQDTITPVWPLKDYVAVNPYHGITDRPFFKAREFLRSFSDCEMLMPFAHYAQQFKESRFGINEIHQALVETAFQQQLAVAAFPPVAEIVNRLKQDPLANSPITDQAVARNLERPIRTVAEVYDRRTGCDWSATICDDVSLFCASHYDDGQATWPSPFKHLGLYTAWRSSAARNRSLEILGLSGLRRYVSHCPNTPEASIVYSLNQLAVPRHLWESFLLCQAFDLPGWSAWTKYQATERLSDLDAFVSLLAIRLAYDAALSSSFEFKIDWDTVSAATLEANLSVPNDDVLVRHVLLRASELSYQNELLSQFVNENESTNASQSINASQNGKANLPAVSAQRKLAQIVFCIDVRSERIRRHIETESAAIETFGFAGFFGMPIEYVPLGGGASRSQVPALLKPQFKLHERIVDSDPLSTDRATQKRFEIRSLRKAWKGFKTSAVGMFTFVETLGLIDGISLFSRAIGRSDSYVDAKFDGTEKNQRADLGPSLEMLQSEGIDLDRQADIAESMLRNLGLTADFAKLVVFCGHSSETENNPLKAGLDCGACCGHSGEPNARFAARLLNQPSIRTMLASRGIPIPSDTYFLGGLHNTTSDEITFFDQKQVRESHAQELQELIAVSASASALTRTERMPQIAATTSKDLMKRSGDWSEVRPEWGLAGNAAFIVAPRSMTAHMNLDGRAFLHSYDHTRDTGFKVLETIMTAPMVVAHWINMQYYASTVDNRTFGSGNKTVHNVVGRFGILSGNAGDLMIGLPMQSLHTGEKLQHLPLRLLVVLAAPRQAIQKVIEKHTLIENLISGGWLNLVSVEDGDCFRYSEGGSWVQELFNKEKQVTK